MARAVSSSWRSGRRLGGLRFAMAGDSGLVTGKRKHERPGIGDGFPRSDTEPREPVSTDPSSSRDDSVGQAFFAATAALAALTTLAAVMPYFSIRASGEPLSPNWSPRLT